MDLSALFQPRQPIMSKSQAIEIMNGHNSLLRSMQCCVIEHRKFSILPKEEKGVCVCTGIVWFSLIPRPLITTWYKAVAAVLT